MKYADVNEELSTGEDSTRLYTGQQRRDFIKSHISLDSDIETPLVILHLRMQLILL